jgi:hypothetical protein
MSSCGAELEANSLLTALLAGKSFPIPTVDLADPNFSIPSATGDLFADIEKLTNDDLTTRTVGGTGTFDALMAGFDAHLKREYDDNRITGEQYAKAYVELTTAAMGNAVQFLLGRDQAYWQAITAQIQAQLAQVQMVTARVELQTAKANLQAISYQALTSEAAYGLGKMKIATEEITYCAGTFNLENILPEQQKLVSEQAEAQRAQTLDTRSDGLPVAGSVGKQKDLYDQQIEAYDRDGQVKAGKLFVDAWITQKTIDEGTLPPTNFNNASLDTILASIKAKNF